MPPEDASTSPAPPPVPLLVICLCAQWCATCRDYRATFQQVEARFPLLRFAWIDIEDEADLVDPVDVVDFPTLLIARGGDPVFFGPLIPQPEALSRLLLAHSAAEPGSPALSVPELRGLLERIAGQRG
jgi:thioredoxin 1